MVGEQLVVQLGPDEVVLRHRQLQAHGERVDAATEEEEEEADEQQALADGVVLDGHQLAEQPGWVRPEPLHPLGRVGRDVGGSGVSRSARHVRQSFEALDVGDEVGKLSVGQLGRRHRRPVLDGVGIAEERR